MSLPRAKVRSSVRCGREVWPPLPISRTLSASAAPVSGPSRRPIRPTSRLGSQCRPKTCETPSSAPAGDQVQRAAGHDLLGGLEEQADAPGQQAARGDLGEGEAGADEAGGVDVVAAGVGDAGVRCCSTGRRSGRRPAARRGRRAAPPARRPAPISASTPPPSGRVMSQPAPSRRRDDPVGGAVTRSSSARGGRAGRGAGRSARRRTCRRSHRPARGVGQGWSGEELSGSNRRQSTVGRRRVVGREHPVGGQRRGQLAGQHRPSYVVAHRRDAGRACAAAGRARRAPAPR